MDINATMQREAAEGEVYRREKEAAIKQRKVVPVSSLPKQSYKAKPMHEQVATALAERDFSPRDRQYLEKLAQVPRI